MKKILMSFLALFAVIAFGDITSENTVGYTTKAVEANKLYMFAVQFNKVGDTTDTIKIEDLITLGEGIVPGSFDANFVGAPTIMVLKPSGAGYSNFYYISDAYDGDDPIDGNCWADTEGNILSDTSKLSLGSGFWFSCVQNGSIALSGEVKKDVTAQIDVVGNRLIVVANKFPKNTSLSDVTTVDLAASSFDSNFANAPMIMVLKPSGSGYSNYYFISDAYDGDDPVDGNCWADAEGNVLTGSQIEVGNSFWIQSPTAGSIGFSL